MGTVNAVPGSNQFFSVSHTCVINGQSFRPGVCYRLTGNLQKAVEEMKEKELARTYPAEVRFVSGVAYPAQKAAPPKPVPEAPRPAAGMPATGDPVTIPKAGRAGASRKGGYTQQDKRDFF
jgi:hypothetical protein